VEARDFQYHRPIERVNGTRVLGSVTRVGAGYGCYLWPKLAPGCKGVLSPYVGITAVLYKQRSTADPSSALYHSRYKPSKHFKVQGEIPSIFKQDKENLSLALFKLSVPFITGRHIHVLLPY